MIKLTQTAADQIKESAKTSEIDTPRLRLAATRKDDGSIEYGMGFDDNTTESDKEYQINGITFVMSQNSAALLAGTEIDYVEISPGQFNFIFVNPNDPAHKPAPDQ